MSDYKSPLVKNPEDINPTSSDIPDEEWDRRAEEDTQISSYERGVGNG